MIPLIELKDNYVIKNPFWIIKIFHISYIVFVKIAACYSNPCNSGTCYDLQLPQLSLGGFYCVCPAGFTGTQCEKEINECLSSPCKNGAQCLDLVGSFFCSCQNGFTGVICETRIINFVEFTINLTKIKS